MRLLACPSVKLLRPATGWLEFLVSGLFTALLFGPDCAGCDCAAVQVNATATQVASIIWNFILGALSLEGKTYSTCTQFSCSWRAFDFHPRQGNIQRSVEL